MPTSDIKKGPLYVDSTNNSVGIGTTTNNQSSSTASVTLNAASGMSAYELRNADVFSGYVGNTGTNMYLVNAKNGSLGLYTNNTERMHLTSTGNVGIGVVPETTYVQKTTLRLSSTASLIAGTSYYPYPYYIANNLNYDASDNLKYIANSGGALLSVNAHTGGSFSFYTAPAGTAGATASLTERLRIDSSGGISKNGSFSYSGTSDDFYWNTGTGDRFRFHSGTTSSRDILGFSNPNGVVGSIETSGTSTSYNTSSDYRLKTAVTYDWDATSRLKQLRPARFEWIADGDDAVPVDGFLAHEVQDIVPEAISGTHDEVDDDGNPVYQGIDQSKLTPLLTKALIEAVEKIEQLEARITALEAN